MAAPGRRLFGSRRIFQVAVAIHAVAMATVALSVSPAMLFAAQAAQAAVIAPALVVFITANYSGEGQARAIGYLAAAIPAAGVLALLIAGSFASTIGRRWSFALVTVLGAANLLLSTRLKAIPAQPDVQIDRRRSARQIARFGFVLVAVALTLLAFTIRNELSQFVVAVGLILLGLGQGAIVALVFNTLLSSAPKRLSGDVGAWRGLVHTVSGSVGIAVAIDDVPEEPTGDPVEDEAPALVVAPAQEQARP